MSNIFILSCETGHTSFFIAYRSAEEARAYVANRRDEDGCLPYNSSFELNQLDTETLEVEFIEHWE